MSEENQLKAFFVFLFFFCVMAISQGAMASMVATPVVPGYSVGYYKAAAGPFTAAANGASYGASGVISVGGKAVTVPATLRMAANAGKYALDGMRLTPAGIVGTLAAGWLLEQGFEWLNNQWQKTVPGQHLYYSTSPYVCGTGTAPVNAAAMVACFTARAPQVTWSLVDIPADPFHAFMYANGTYHDTINRKTDAAPTVTEPTPADWDALPDPLSVVAPELPYAPYLPLGAPVDAPSYEFSPMSVPIGEPYTKPDNSTAQPMARISPNSDSVTIDTYDHPLTDTAGAPVPNAPPVDTPEPPPESKTDCEKFPAHIGCAEFGTVPAAEPVGTASPVATPDYSAIGGAGSCPAPVTVRGITWSYQPFCNFAQAINPIVIGFAWLSFAFIVAGAVRS